MLVGCIWSFFLAASLSQLHSMSSIDNSCSIERIPLFFTSSLIRIIFENCPILGRKINVVSSSIVCCKDISCLYFQSSKETIFLCVRSEISIPDTGVSIVTLKLFLSSLQLFWFFCWTGSQLKAAIARLRIFQKDKSPASRFLWRLMPLTYASSYTWLRISTASKSEQFIEYILIILSWSITYNWFRKSLKKNWFVSSAISQGNSIIWQTCPPIGSPTIRPQISGQ